MGTVASLEYTKLGGRQGSNDFMGLKLMSMISDFLRRGIATLKQGKTVFSLTQTAADELSRRATLLKIAHRVLDDKRGLYKIEPDLVVLNEVPVIE